MWLYVNCGTIINFWTSEPVLMSQHGGTERAERHVLQVSFSTNFSVPRGGIFQDGKVLITCCSHHHCFTICFHSDWFQANVYSHIDIKRSRPATCVVQKAQLHNCRNNLHPLSFLRVFFKIFL
jgi:hypothetical protein